MRLQFEYQITFFFFKLVCLFYTTEHRLPRNFRIAECVSRYITYPNQHDYGAVQIIGADIEHSCKKICRVLDLCIAVDFNTAYSECYAYITSDTREFSLVNGSGVFHHRLVQKCPYGGIVASPYILRKS